MVEIFYRVNGQMTVSRSESELQAINLQDVVWIDLLSPTGDEKRAVEAYLGTVIQSRATAEEIESSSRFSETDAALFANTNFVIPGPESYVMETVSFIIKGTTLTTLREVQLRSFTELQRRLMVFPKMYTNGYSVFTSILEQRIDSDADMIEILSKEIEQYNHKVGLEEDINEEFLLDINQLQENTMLLRETIVDKQRVISSILKSPKCPKSIQNKLNVMLKDISSLVNHTNFSFERLEYLQNTVLGIINLDQNKIMKVFTLISLLLMPPTLIASFYGMNVALPIIPCDSPWNWVIIISMMIISVLIVFFLLKRKKLL
ncbi:MAG: magnesium and cobalt transport protein CorA [Rikenellaceae bacterium]|nr:magnesium and cobalt transport protein CorA [Rikenellaceae bacterium]